MGSVTKWVVSAQTRGIRSSVWAPASWPKVGFSGKKRDPGRWGRFSYLSYGYGVQRAVGDRPRGDRGAIADASINPIIKRKERG